MLGTGGSYQKLQDMEDSSLETLQTAWLCQHIDFELLAFRTVREYISIVI
jgi:hypothetical protein